jgi:hypothetical protein
MVGGPGSGAGGSVAVRAAYFLRDVMLAVRRFVTNVLLTEPSRQRGLLSPRASAVRRSNPFVSKVLRAERARWAAEAEPIIDFATADLDARDSGSNARSTPGTLKSDHLRARLPN